MYWVVAKWKGAELWFLYTAVRIRPAQLWRFMTTGNEMFDKEKQKKVILPRDKARVLLTDLMHEGYDTFCSEADTDGNLTVIWPASITTGKQLE